jgi:hypothetical protein
MMTISGLQAGLSPEGVVVTTLVTTVITTATDRMATPVSKNSGRLSTITTPELNMILPESLTVGICERYYRCHGERLPKLMAMCLGLKTVIGGDRILGDAMVEPYASMKFRKKVTPTQQHMVEEIKRRARCGDDPAPACKYWAKEKLMTWLKENPLTMLPDILFLRKEERKLYNTVGDGLNEAAEGPRASSWTTNDPYLRIYHCMFHEDVKASLADMSRVLDHDELDARNSSEWPPDFFQAEAFQCGSVHLHLNRDILFHVLLSSIVSS